MGRNGERERKREEVIRRETKRRGERKEEKRGRSEGGDGEKWRKNCRWGRGGREEEK